MTEKESSAKALIVDNTLATSLSKRPKQRYDSNRQIAHKGLLCINNLIAKSNLN